MHGCDAVEDMHHLFVHCRLYEEWRREATEEIIKKMVLKLENLDVEEVVQDGLLKAAKSLFLDDPSVWPLHYTMFYLGQLLDLNCIIEHATIPIGEIKKKIRLAYNNHLFGRENIWELSVKSGEIEDDKEVIWIEFMYSSFV